jgi:hypothetical protein
VESVGAGDESQFAETATMRSTCDTAVAADRVRERAAGSDSANSCANDCAGGDARGCADRYGCGAHIRTCDGNAAANRATNGDSRAYLRNGCHS